MLKELSLAHSDGSDRNMIQPYRKVRLLILDGWLLRPLSAEAAKEIFEIMECRSVGRLSTIFCSQFDTTEWLERTCNDLIGESLLDRIFHCSYKIAGGMAGSQTTEPWAHCIVICTYLTLMVT